MRGGVQLCLTLNQGCEALIRRCGRSEAQLQLKRTAQIIQNELNIPAAFLPGDGFSTGNRFYDSACIAARVYSRDAMPTDAVLHGDLEIFYGLYGQYYEKFISVPDHDNDIIYNKGFDLQEAVVLLDVYINARQGGISMTDAAAQASAKLRDLARARGLLIADSFRSAAGLQSRIRCIGYLYEGRESTSLPGTQVFREAVALYKGNRDEFERLLKGAGAMPTKPSKPPSPPKPADVPKAKPALINETRFVRTAGDQALKAAYGETFRDVYYELKRATDGKQVRLTATDIYTALDRRARRRDIIEILDGASWARKVDDTPHYIFYDAEREKRKAQELEDRNKAAEQDFLNWLPGFVPPRLIEDTTRALPEISAMLVRKKFLRKALTATTNVRQVDEAIRQVACRIKDNKLRNTTLYVLKAYATFLRERKNSPAVAPVVPATRVKKNWIRFDFTNCDAFVRTVPVWCEIDGDKLEARNWARMLCAIVERELRKGNPALAELYKRSLIGNRKNKPFFMKQKIKGIHCAQLSNGAWIKISCDIPRFMELIRGFLLHCGYSKTQVAIYGAPRNDAPVKADKPEPEHGTNAVDTGKAEGYLRQAGNTGATVEALIAAVQPGAAVSATRRLLEADPAVVALPEKRYVLAECVYDLDEAGEALASILSAHFRQFGGYSNKALLYGAAVNELSLFLDDNGFNSMDAVYAVARYLFGKKALTGHPYAFSEPHIFEYKPDDPPTLKGLMMRQARLNDGILLADSAEAFLREARLSNPGLNTLLQISSDDSFLMYDAGRYLLKEALGIDDAWVQSLHAALDGLFQQADAAYVIPRDIREGWLGTLPAIPQGLPWTLLLLQEVLRKVPGTGYRPVSARNIQQNLDTIAAAIVPADSGLQSFADVVTLFLQEKYALPVRMSADALRTQLRDAGMISGNEMIYSLHKALDDYRFAFSDGNSSVYVRGN